MFDGLEIIQFFDGPSKVPWHLKAIVTDILELAKEVKIIKFSYVNTSLKSHMLAKAGCLEKIAQCRGVKLQMSKENKVFLL